MSPAAATLGAMSDDDAARLRLALELHDDGVAMMRQNLRRAHPDASDDEIEERLRAWVRHRPGAEHGDAVGTPSQDRFR